MADQLQLEPGDIADLATPIGIHGSGSGDAISDPIFDYIVAVAIAAAL